MTVDQPLFAAPKPIDIITPQKPKNNSTDENKGNTEQTQNKHGKPLLNSYKALMPETTDLKVFVMKEVYINKHFTDLSSRLDLGKYDKEIATLREDCALKNYIIKIFAENLPKYKILSIKLIKKTTIQITMM